MKGMKLMLGSAPALVSKTKIHQQKFTHEGVSQFRFNPCYLFGGEGRPLLNLVLKVDYRKIEDVLSIRSDERVRFHSVTSR
jgi:hypothetical protein